MELIKSGTHIDFVGKRHIFATISGLMVLASLLLFFVKGPNWGIDFLGGTEMQIQFEQPMDIGDLRAALSEIGLAGEAVQQIGQPSANTYGVRVLDPTFGTSGVQSEVIQTLAKQFGTDWIAESKFDAQVGARMTIRYNGSPVPMDQIRKALSPVKGAVVSEALDDNTFYVKLPGLSSKIAEAIQAQLKDHPFKVLSTDSVGPKVGSQLREKGLLSILATLALILVYVAFRFDLTFAPGAVVALFHDVTIVTGIFVITRQEFNLPIIGALLTIIGYSLNDTIVIYDRIRENMRRYRRRETARLINDSVNETLSRTLGTSLTTIIAILPFVFMGSEVIRTFAIAILLGIIFGTYSTIYIASPMILLMEDVKPFLQRVFAPMTAQSEGRRPGSSRPGQAGATEERDRRRRRRRA